MHTYVRTYVRTYVGVRTHLHIQLSGWGGSSPIAAGGLTLTEVEEAGGEDGRTEEAEEDGATDEAETHIFLIGAKPLSDGTEGMAQLTAHRHREREREWRTGQ